ncbi:SH3 domain-containing protein [Rugamonas sp. DEMB1]|uniref:SH3 domain-containing protein n=1 Tax=Rugamonas sp. DEMB1 TaxID=3039386 RepID=UPI0028BF0D7C|nr:SH3 domain-containing protein [Rugamonas sp. DEMB1]
MVRSAGVKVRATADEAALAVFTVDKGVLLELAEPANGAAWIKVRHRDGLAGYVKNTEVWGCQRPRDMQQCCHRPSPPHHHHV